MILKAGVRCGRVTNSSTGCVSTMQRWPPPGHGCAIGTSQCTVPLRRCRGAWWGWGRQLMGYVYEEARKKGASRVYWLTHESNTTAMRLYDQMAERPGFIQYRHVLPRTTG